MSGALVAQAINESIGTPRFQGLDVILKEYLGRIAEQVGTERVPISRTINGHSLASDVDLDNNDVGAAPTGYGLGESAPSITLHDCNDGLCSGWYQVANGATHSPIQARGWMRSDMFSKKYGTQTWHYGQYGGIAAQRYRDNGVWGEWEWVNPPMIPDVEYRTTERWQGKAVYTKLIDMGAIPITGEKSKPIADDATETVEIKGVAYHYSSQAQTHPLPMIDGQTTLVSISVEKGSSLAVVLKSTGNLPDTFFYAKCVVKYTK